MELGQRRNQQPLIDLGNGVKRQRGTEGKGGKLASSDDGGELAKALSQLRNVGRCDYLQILIRSIGFQSTDGRCRVVVANSPLEEERFDGIQSKGAMSGINKVIFIAKEHITRDTPVVVDVIWVEKGHTPSLLLRRKAAKEQHFGIAGQKRLQRMLFDARRIHEGEVDGSNCEKDLRRRT